MALLRSYGARRPGVFHYCRTLSAFDDAGCRVDRHTPSWSVCNGLSHNAAEMESHLPTVTNVPMAQHQCGECADGAHGWSGMKTAVFRRWKKREGVQASRREAGEITVHVVPASNELSVVVAGRVTVDSSPILRSELLVLLRRGESPVIVIDLSAVAYLDMSGFATLLEVLKAARDRSVKLRVTGLKGAARTLAEIAQLDTIFRAWGSEVEFR